MLGKFTPKFEGSLLVPHADTKKIHIGVDSWPTNFNWCTALTHPPGGSQNMTGLTSGHVVVSCTQLRVVFWCLKTLRVQWLKYLTPNPIVSFCRCSMLQNFWRSNDCPQLSHLSVLNHPACCVTSLGLRLPSWAGFLLAESTSFSFSCRECSSSGSTATIHSQWSSWTVQ